MNRTALALIALTVAVSQPAYSHTFKAIAIYESAKAIVLRDTATGNEWVAEVGDEIDGYRIVEITPAYVTIAKPGEGRKVFVTKIPIIRKQPIRKDSQ